MKTRPISIRKPQEYFIHKTPMIIVFLWCFTHLAIAQTTVCFSIAGEAEEALSTGNVNLTSSDFELGADTELGTPGLQVVGLRYTGFSLPTDATITNADIQFVADETSNNFANLTIKGESTGNAMSYGIANSNISNRSQTTASVNWQPAQWTSIGTAGAAQKTPDLSEIINEITAHPDFAFGNAISFIITGTGTRTAENSPIDLCVTYFVCGTEGTACDDGMICTINDVWDSNCNCAGTPDTSDSDNDNICDAADQCPNFDDTLIGTPCDDGDPETLNDAWQTNCTCQGGGEIVINEFSAANHDSNIDNYGEYEDWIELYNNNAVPFDLSGYHLSDNTNDPTKWAFPVGTTIAANDHLLVWCSNRNESTDGNIHSSFKITQTQGSEEIVFADPMGNILDSNNIDIPNQRGHSWGRLIDGGSEWGVLLNPTPNSTNTNVKLPYASKPVLSPEAGFFSGSVEVSIESPDDNVTIYYTTNGNPPDATSTVYTAPFTLNATAVVKALTVSNNPDIPPSAVDFHTYFVNDNHTVKVISIAGDEVDDLLNGAGFGYYGESENFIGSLELFNENQTRVADATGDMNKHGNDSWAYAQRGIDFIARDEFGDDYAVKNEIFDMFNTTNRDKFQRLILKAAANDNYSFEQGGAHIRDAYVHTLSQLAGLDLDERSYEPCVLYVNGEYWGMYEIREKVDDNDFTKYYYDQGRSDIQFIKTWGGTWVEYGGNTALNDWNQLYNFIVNNDMTDPSNYDLVEKQLNLQSLVDYMIINTHVVCTDWLNYNTAWWRGLDMDANPEAFKWRYTMWDLDATFGHYINYTGVPDQSPEADPCDNESPVIDDPEGHTEMLTSLLENETFYALYINRYADLNNTYFTCDYMIDLLDQMTDRIAPEMPRQVARWGGSMNGWMNNVDELKDFINTRCTVINEGLEDCYEIEGPYNLTVIVDPPGAGDVRVNTLIPLSYPYEADYFGGVPLSLTAIPEGFNTFDNWTPLNSTLTPNNTTSNVSFEMTEFGDTIIAHFTVFECPPFNITPNVMPADCSGGGSAGVIVMGGAGGPYEFQWDENTGDQTSLTAEDLSAGDYTITVTDVAGCEEIVSVTVPATGGALTVEIATSDAVCGSPTGLAEVTPTSGAAPFTYQWNDPENQSIANPSLPPGDYTVTITDAMDCETIQNITIASSGGLEVDIEENDISCSGGNDGTASVSTLGDFTYLWSNNSTAASISNLAAGTYTVTVTQSGCETIETVIISEPTPLNLVLDTNESACSSSGSSATAIGSGGIAPYTYAWSTGDNTSTIGGLDNGNYGVTIVDANGCEALQNFTINAQSNAPSLLTSQGNISCNGETDGTIDLSINNGTPPFNYSWNNGATTEDLDNLAPGNYTLVVTDANGCIAVTTVSISEPNVMTLTPESMPSSGSNGWAAVNVSGGTPPYTYQWSDGQTTQIATGLAPGTYTAMVTDTNGCTVDGSAMVDQFTNIINLEHLKIFDIYPNPSDGLFTIDVQFSIMQTVDIQIFSTLGQLVYQTSGKQSHFVEAVNIQHIAAGTYFVKVQTEQGQAVRKIVLK